jgi:hypothetical protein
VGKEPGYVTIKVFEVSFLVVGETASWQNGRALYALILGNCDKFDFTSEFEV